MLRVVEARDLTSGWNDLEIHRELLGWARAYKADPTGLRSLAVVFREPGGLDEPAFEQALWARIQSLADKDARSEEHTSELQSLMRISYAVFCLKKKKERQRPQHHNNH